MQISFDQQIVSQRCDECNVDFTVVRGSAFDSDEPFALYMIALHGHAQEGRLAHAAIAVLDRSGVQPQASAAAIQVIEMPTQIGYSFTDWADSPWKNEAYLGEMLDRLVALASPFKGLFLHVAEHLVLELPQVRDYFA